MIKDLGNIFLIQPKEEP